MEKKNKRALLAVLLPLGLGILTALAFLMNYLGRTQAVVTLVNASGVDVMGGILRLSSENHGQEVGPIKAGDSASVAFRDISDGEYVWVIDMKGGTRISDSAGYVTHGVDFKDRLLIETADGVPRIRLIAK